MSANATFQEGRGLRTTVADVGDRIVASAVLFLALLVTLGIAGVPFVDWIAQVLMVVAGLLMLRGLLGTNEKVGATLVILGPALLVLPAFYPALSVVFPVTAAVLLWLGGIVKIFGLW